MSWWKRTIYEEFGPEILERFEQWHKQRNTPYGQFISEAEKFDLASDKPEDNSSAMSAISFISRGYIDQTKDELVYEYFYGPSDTKEIKREISERRYKQKWIYVHQMSVEDCRLYDLGRKQARQDAKAFRVEMRTAAR